MSGRIGQRLRSPSSAFVMSACLGMIGALESMGSTASAAAPLVRRLRASLRMNLETRFGDDLDRLEETAARVLEAIEAH